MDSKPLTSSRRSRTWLPWLVPVLILLLVVWQIPLSSLVQRQVGTRAFVQLIFQQGVTAAGPGRPVLARLDPNTVQGAVGPLRQAQTQLDSNRTLGLIALTTHDLAGAEERLQRRLAVEPADALAQFWLGETYLRLGETATAVEQWVAARAHAPLLALVGELRARQGPAGALAALKTIVANDPAAVEARVLAIKLGGGNENTAQVMAWYQEIIQLEPKNIAARQALARYWLARGNPEEALALAQEIIDIAPEEATGYVLGGDI